MSPDAPAKHPPGFRARRGLNWGFLGLLYTSFYLCRYNLSIANKSISDEFGFSRAEMGVIITTARTKSAEKKPCSSARAGRL
jgi:OPA family glycerol-3-phosphate transporter-like MFS transporter